MWCRAHFKFQGNYRTTCPMTPMTFSQNLGWFRIHDYSLIPHLHWFLRRWRPRRPSKGTSARDGTFLRRINTHLVQKEKRITNTLEHKSKKHVQNLYKCIYVSVYYMLKISNLYEATLLDLMSSNLVSCYQYTAAMLFSVWLACSQSWTDFIPQAER